MDRNELEANKILHAYQARDERMPYQDWHTNIYHPRHPLGTLFRQHNHLICVEALNQLEIDLGPLKILDVGCGFGHWLRYLVELGALAENLTGIDLSAHRIERARQMNPAIQWMQNSEMRLLFPDCTFDMIMQIVVFSSISDEDSRQFVAEEMGRVTKENGYLFWIDHKQPMGTLAGFTLAQVSDYFRDFSLVYSRSVHPRYFRRLYKYGTWLPNTIYSFTKYQCDSWLFVFRKDLKSERN